MTPRGGRSRGAMRRRVPRRKFLAALFAPAAWAQPVTDAEKLNAFAGDYNRYVERLRQGIVDLKLWARVRKAWQRMTGG